MPVNYKFTAAVSVLLLALGFACSFSPTSPFEGFDGMGSRISGEFVSEGTSSAALKASRQSTFENVTVSVKQDPSIQTSVKSNGTFTLEGIPDGTVTLVFKSDVQLMGEIMLRDVRPNQEIRIVVELTVDLRVVLVEEERDEVDDDSADDDSADDDSADDDPADDDPADDDSADDGSSG